MKGEELPITARRRLIFRFVQLLATGGLAAMIFKFIRGGRAGDLEICFKRKPVKDEVIFNGGVYLVGLENGVSAFSSRCPHLGCRLTYDSGTSGFQCPCHGSRFTREGRRLSGPAPGDMTSLELFPKDDETGFLMVRLPVS